MDTNTHTHVPKIWGCEDWIVNNELYCGKILTLTPGYQCSLHYHPIKTETFYIQGGKVGIELRWPDYTGPSEIQTLYPGDSITLYPGVAHRFWAISSYPATVFEFSTPHSDIDVVRLEASGVIPDEV